PSCDTVCGYCLPNNVSVVKCDLYTGFCVKGCVDSYFGRRCKKKCGHCLPDDNGRVACDINTGNCLNPCIAGYFGPSCFDKCNSNCFDSNTNTNRCDRLSGNCIYGCVSGWYGDMCNKTCSNTCQNRSCRQKSGNCEGRCLSGWYGDTCNITCSSMCSERSCCQNSGYCKNGCVSGWYGDSCNVSCSSNCNGTSCDQNLGQCDGGCIPGFFGHTCKFNCVDTCKNGVCDKETSECTQGCVTGYEGAFCNTTTDNGQDCILVGMTSSLAGVVTSLVFVFIVWFIRRKIIKGKRYNCLQMSTRESAVPLYDDILNINDTSMKHFSGSDLYTEVGTTHTPMGTHDFRSSMSTSCDNETGGNCASTTFEVDADAETNNTEKHRVSESYSYIEIDATHPRSTHESGSNTRIIYDNDFAATRPRDSNRTLNKDLMSTRNKEIDANDINATPQKSEEDNCNTNPSVLNIEMQFKPQADAIEGDNDSLNYIHPVH
ncbi:protein draper-like, partial [Mercenaria mercenaria]|uniref:protein draper-like n=1 Tax=Mercenaria mercenaria TaxID=6596 RepID=UPI00234ECC5F